MVGRRRSKATLLSLNANNAMLFSWISGENRRWKYRETLEQQEVGNAGFSISPPLYYPLARSWAPFVYYTSPHSCRLTRLSANFSDYRISTNPLCDARCFDVNSRFLFFFFFFFCALQRYHDVGIDRCSSK